MLNNVISSLLAGLIVALVSCAAGDGGKEVITSISCKNESTGEIREATVKVDDRSFGFGFIGIGNKKTMGVGNIAGVRRLLSVARRTEPTRSKVSNFPRTSWQRSPPRRTRSRPFTTATASGRCGSINVEPTTNGRSFSRKK